MFHIGYLVWGEGGRERAAIHGSMRARPIESGPLREQILYHSV